jgi:CubicO group peptidase (beta-lactamase class C family)
MKKYLLWLALCACLVGTSVPVFGAEQSAVHHALHPWDDPGPSSGVIHKGSAAAAGMMQAPLDAIDAQIQTAIQNKVMPGAVVLIARRGVIVKEQAYGYAAEYLDDKFTPMPHPVPMRTDTIFDLASVSKLFTSTAIMQLYDQGKIRLDDPVAKYIPEFAANGKEQVTIRQLLTHTSGFEPWIPLYKMDSTRDERLQEVFKQPLEYPPGTHYVYSDLNLITLGALVERLSGERLDTYVHDHITAPLGMNDTMYNPPASLKWRIAATEYQPWTNRGLVWGQVHDENAWSLDGVAGHAGVFSTARDLAVFAQMILDGGVYKGKRILSKEAVKLMNENQLPQFPGDDHGLGWELNQGWYMDALGDANTLGHTGFTGTSIVVSPDNDTICIVLTNRVHPTRNTVSTNPVRRMVARQAALAIPVDIPWKEGAWFSGMGDNANHTLTQTVNLPNGGTLKFDTWYRTEPNADYGYVEASADGQTWNMVASFTGSSDWKSVSFNLPAGTTQVRFRYSTDATVNGRGWYVHDPIIYDANGTRKSADWVAQGWLNQHW